MELSEAERSGASSFGVVFRDFRGVIMTAFTSFLGYDKSALEAEMCGIIFAINTAHFFGIQNVWIENDSLQAVFLLRHRTGEAETRVGRRYSKSVVNGVRVSHILREGNSVADKLPDYPIKKKGLSYWNNTPLFVMQEAVLDVGGQTYFRVKTWCINIM